MTYNPNESLPGQLARREGETLRYLVFLMLTPVLFAADLKVKTTFQQVPIDSDLIQAWDVEIDEKDNLYVVDVSTNVIHTWDARGEYTGHFITKGQGPGEVVFKGQGGNAGFVDVYKGEIFVWDAGSNRINVYDKNKQYLRAIKLALSAGRCTSMRVVDDERIFFAFRGFFKNQPTIEFVLLDREGNVTQKLWKAEDHTFDRVEKGGQRLFIFNAFVGKLHANFDGSTGQFVVGNSTDSLFKIYDSAGNELTAFTAELKATLVTDADKEEFKELSWMKRNANFDAAFPEYRSYYDLVFPLKQGLLVATISVGNRTMNGYLLDKKGKTISRVTYSFGSGGRPFYRDGRLFGVTLDANDDAEMIELTL